MNLSSFKETSFQWTLMKQVKMVGTMVLPGLQEILGCFLELMPKEHRKQLHGPCTGRIVFSYTILNIKFYDFGCFTKMNYSDIPPFLHEYNPPIRNTICFYRKFCLSFPFHYLLLYTSPKHINIKCNYLENGFCKCKLRKY